ncbi:hypothetical protein [Pelagicoccus sp. SDUM812002]|uniref:hypothetical protein n=1 Tax=Pelagicoccus sp. SDUM812002 TaxID=3041266 RepID=UPI00280D05A7|nr:hypothetical protein [Pelagicoccus sp. SDUM812002]MDQ8187463.1 hypothetical protein [Pelagicoccus sp. SDUM812002]
MQGSFIVTAALALTFFLTACGGEKEFSPNGVGPLESIILKGRDQAWTGSSENGVYTLDNSGDTGAIKYFYTPYNGEDAGRRVISVHVDAEGASPEGRAGLLYGFDQSPLSYYAIVASPDHLLEIYRRDQEGFAMTSSTSFDPAASGFEQIVVEESEDQISISVNGRQVSSLQASGVGRGAVGILAMGSGRFAFTNYTEKGSSNGQVSEVSNREIKAESTRAPAYQFKDRAVLDVSRNSIAAYNLFVPEGWKLEGQFEQIPAFHNVPYFGAIDVKAPDGRAFSYLPLAEFTYTDFAQLGFMQPYEGRPAYRLPPNLGDIMKTIAQASPEKTISNLQIISEEPAPELIENSRNYARSIYQQIEAANRQAGAYGEKQAYHVDARKVVARYSENGMQIESTTFATITNYAFIQPNGGTRIAKWNLLNVVSLAGPVGSDYLNDPQLAAVARSVRINPDWAYAIDQWGKGARQQAIKEGIAKAAAANQSWQNTQSSQSEDVLDISFNGWKSRNASSDRSQSRIVNGIHERTTYATPTGGTVNLPSYYQNAYTDGQGNYVLHNSSLYDINTDPSLNSTNWTRIQEAQ